MSGKQKTVTENEQGLNTQGKGRRMMLLLIVLFALPLLAVMGMYQFNWSPGGSSYGELVTPPRALQLVAVKDLQGREFAPAQWKDKWNMVYVAAADCPAACQDQVHLLRQVHVALNKEVGRVQRLLLIPSMQDAAALEDLQRKYPDLIILAGGEVAGLSRQFDLPGQPAGPGGQVYLVDPLGNLMMRYPQGHDPKGLLKDLTRLLKYSWVG
jgi:cytochrome oxidase Cu insertion factor (SCO1/SenC/PrrC family)